VLAGSKGMKALSDKRLTDVTGISEKAGFTNLYIL